MFNNPRPGQYFTHAHSNITREVRAMDSYFTLIRAHQHDTSVGPALYGQSRVQTPHYLLVVWTDTSYKH